LATTNLISTLTGVNKALAKKNVTSKDRYAVISPEFESILVQYVEAKATVKGDQVGLNGYLMTYMGYDFYVSNQLTSTAELVLSQDVTEKWTVNTDWISEFDASWLEDLFKSTEVYHIDSNNNILPIIVEDKSYEVKTYNRNQLFNVTMNFSYAYDIRVQNS
jgi:hypothetical protein